MPSEWENNSSSSSTKVSSSSASSLSASSSTATSPEPNANGNNNNNNNDSAKNGHGKDCALKASTMSHDPTPYVARARVTRPTPPKPSCNPMQFVQIKPCNLYQSAQQQLKKAEEIKKVKEVLKEEPEDWQNNLDNWKSSRRKRVEHIIDRVVEVKKLEQEEHDRTRRKSKTFSEMMEERGERGRARPKLQSLASYNEDEANDLSDLGIGTSSASGKSSISEDCEVHSIVSEPAEVENLSSFDIENNSCQPCHDNHNRDRISSPGYETSSTAPVASPGPYEYTYEGAIEDYKSRVSKATASSIYKKPGLGENSTTRSLIFDRKPASSDCDNDSELTATVKKEDLPKIDISKKRELFEKPEITKRLVSPFSVQNHDQIEKKRIPSEFANVRSIKDRLCSLEKKPESVDEPTAGILSGEITSIKERLQCLEQQKQQNSVNPKPNTNKVVAEVVAVPPLKDRLSSLQNAVTKEEIIKKPVVLVDEYQLEMLKNEEIARRQLDTSKDDSVEKAPSDDSGINTTDEKIDQEPATTTEDEDDEEEPAEVDENAARDGGLQTHEEKVPPSASTNEFQGEFDSSVSFLQLKNLNTPTVVSLVDKPVVVDVGGGNTLFNSSKVIRNDDDGEVNHAQNLLRMFKLAFSEDDLAEESATPKEVIENNVDRDKTEEVGLTKTQESEKKVKECRVPWRKPVECSEVTVNTSKIPHENSEASEFKSTEPASKVCNPVEETLKKSIIQASKIPQVVSKPHVSASRKEEKEKELEVEIPIVAGSDITEIVKKSLGNSPKTPAFKEVTSIEQILTECLSNESLKGSKESLQSIESNKNVNISEKIVFETPEKSRKPQEFQISSPKPKIEAENNSKRVFSDSRLETNLILNIDNNQKKSMIPVASKMQPSSPKTDVESPKLDSPSPVSPRIRRKLPNVTPIYENVSFDTDISRPNTYAGLKKVSSPQNNGRVEIFNSKSMPPKPKSPEVLPRTIKSYPSEDLKSEIQSKDFQQSAMTDFFKNLESWQPKVVGEKPKHRQETSSKNPFNNSQIVEETVEIAPNLQTPETIGEVDKNYSSIVEEVSKFAESVLNPETPENTSSVGDITKPLEPNENLPSPGKENAKPTDSLPFESCVDILQSFLAAERSYPASTTDSPLSKKSNQSSSGTSDGFIRQETIVEVPCSKIDVKDLPDPNFIRTSCIDVDCGDKLIKDSIKSPQAQIRDSVSSAGDSSPSSEITVIFKPKAPPVPGSPTPNKSSLMQIANRVNSPIAGRRDLPSRQQMVVEKPCLKLDVKDLPDPNFIRTPCIEVEKRALRECSASSRPNSPLTPSTPSALLQRTNAEILKKTCDDLSNSPPLSPVLGSRNPEKPNLLIARVEVVETKIKVTTTNDTEVPPAVPASSPPPILPAGSPNLKPKSAQNSKPKNIFEFLKKNFQSKPDSTEAALEAEEFEPISIDNSKFYVPSDVISSSSTSKSSPSDDPQANNGVNIEITKTITTDAIVEQTDSELNLTDEINEILDEEISKLVVEDAKL